MQIRRGAIGAVLLAIVVAGCGSTAHRSAAQTNAPAKTQASSGPAKPPAGLLGRVLTSNELAGFIASPTTVETGASSYLAGSGESSARQIVDTKRLTKLGFIRGVLEDLGQGSTAGLSTVEQFKTAKAAETELAYGAAQFSKENAGQGKYTHFAVPGIPGAVGYGVVGSGDTGGVNIAFTKGPYYYLVGQQLPGQGSPKTSIAHLITAGQHLYQRVSP